MSSITADEYRTAAKVDRHHGGQSAAQFYEDNARALESEDLVTQVAMQFAGSTWGGRDAEEQFALAGSERALAYLVGAGRLIPAGGMALTAEQVEDVRIVTTEVGGYTGEQFRRWHAAKDRLVDALFPATEPAEEFSCTWGTVGCTCDGPLGDVAQKAANAAPAEPSEEETKAEEFCCHPTCRFTDWGGINRKHERGADCPIVPKPASSPVVPAPTETGPQTLEGPWDRIEDIPKTVGRVTDRDGDAWEWDGDNWVTPETAILPVLYINRKYAPFVAAEEG